MRHILLLVVVFQLLVPEICHAQLRNSRKLVLKLDDVLQLAASQSPMGIRAKHEFRGKYWEYRTYKANRLPNLMLNTSPVNLSQSIQNQSYLGKSGFFETNELKSSAQLTVNQNIGLTGGNVFINSGIQRIDYLNDSINMQYSASPIISIGISQPINGYNELKWRKKIDPLKFEEAKRNYVFAIENVSLRAIQLFFDLGLAQLNLDISNTNYANADTLYKIARGRFNIGTIAENELLQMELSKLNAATDVNMALVDKLYKQSQMRSFLGFNESVEIEIVLPGNVSDKKMQLDSVLSEAMKNNPNMLSFERQLLEADQEVAKTRAEKRFNGNLVAEYGLNKEARNLNQAYVHPSTLQMVQVGFQIPLIDWGLKKGMYKMAQSNRELVQSVIDQQRIEFEQDIFLKVMQFNLQGELLSTSAKADTVAQMRYNVIKQRFLIGKISITDLNIAVAEKDVARRGFIASLRNYWSNLYEIRRIALFDFVANKPIVANYDQLIR